MYYTDNEAGTEELAHLEMVGSIVSQLTTGEGAKSFDKYGVGDYYVDHANAVYPASAAGVPFTAAYIQSKADPIADLTEDLAAEGAACLGLHSESICKFFYSGHEKLQETAIILSNLFPIWQEVASACRKSL